MVAQSNMVATDIPIKHKCNCMNKTFCTGNKMRILWVAFLKHGKVNQKVVKYESTLHQKVYYY